MASDPIASSTTGTVCVNLRDATNVRKGPLGFVLVTAEDEGVLFLGVTRELETSSFVPRECVLINISET